MRNLSTVLIMLLLVTLCSGCEGFLSGVGAGAAGQETLESWKENLIAKKAELQARYDKAFAELESAPDPNTIALAKQKLQEVQLAQVANEAALFTIQAALDYPKDQPKDDRTDFFASVLIGIGVFAYEAMTKRKLNLKYTSMKEGQATFQAADPSAGQKLYTSIGIARSKRGL